MLENNELVQEIVPTLIRFIPLLLITLMVY